MFEWKPEYAVGITEIDRQHQELFRMADEIYDMVVDVSEEEQMAEVFRLLAALKHYADEHFSLEESLMARYEYPGVEAHRQEHDKFRVQLETLSAEKESQTRQQMVTELIKFITQWIFQHIRTVDTAYAPLLRAQLH